MDEHAQSLLTRIINKCFENIDHFLFENIGREHLLPALSVVGTVAFILGVGYLMAHLVRMEEENVKKKNRNDNNNSKQSNYVPELKLHELRAEKYNGLVRLLKPGCRTIVLLTDLQSRPKLIPAYHAAVWPYRKYDFSKYFNYCNLINSNFYCRNKTLMFSHMLIEKGLNWYSELLRLSLSESRDLNINPRNCIGTVIALNGHRKYFCMYHAKHPESIRGAKVIEICRLIYNTRFTVQFFLEINIDQELSKNL